VYRITSRRRLIVNCILTTSSLARKTRKDVYNAPEHMDTEIARLKELWEDGQDHRIVRSTTRVYPFVLKSPFSLSLSLSFQAIKLASSMIVSSSIS
jgi:hypothetical protein